MSDIDLDAIRAELDEASGAIDAPDAQYDWASLQALRAAETLLDEVARLRKELTEAYRTITLMSGGAS